MGFREVLQAEIWSKEATRKFLRPIWRVSKYVGVGFGVVVVAIAIFVSVSTHWLTGKERLAANVALAQVDRLQNEAEESDAEFDAQFHVAEENANDAARVAITAKDQATAFFLHQYLTQVQDTRRRKKLFAKVRSRAGYVQSERSQEMDAEFDETDGKLVAMTKAALDQSLGKRN